MIGVNNLQRVNVNKVVQNIYAQNPDLIENKEDYSLVCFLSDMLKSQFKKPIMLINKHYKHVNVEKQIFSLNAYLSQTSKIIDEDDKYLGSQCTGRHKSNRILKLFYIYILIHLTFSSHW